MGMSIISDLLHHHHHHMLSYSKCIRGPKQAKREQVVCCSNSSFIFAGKTPHGLQTLYKREEPLGRRGRC